MSPTPEPAMVEVTRNPDDREWDRCPLCKTGSLDTGFECNSCGFDAQPLANLQEACEASGDRMHPSGLYFREMANPLRVPMPQTRQTIASAVATLPTDPALVERLTTAFLIGAGWTRQISPSVENGVRAMLAAIPTDRPMAGDGEFGDDWPVDWKTNGYNHAITQAQKALRYLAVNDRPIGGEQFPNSASCEMIAAELETTRKRYAALTSARADHGSGETIADGEGLREAAGLFVFEQRDDDKPSGWNEACDHIANAFRHDVNPFGIPAIRALAQPPIVKDGMALADLDYSFSEFAEHSQEAGTLEQVGFAAQPPIGETRGNGGEVSIPTDAQVREAMQTAWDDFCADAQAIPGDIRRERGRTYFEAGTWADHTAMHLRAALATSTGSGS